MCVSLVMHQVRCEMEPGHVSSSTKPPQSARSSTLLGGPISIFRTGHGSPTPRQLGCSVAHLPIVVESMRTLYSDP